MFYKVFISRAKMSINYFFNTVSFRVIKYFVLSTALVWYLIAKPNRFSAALSKFQFKSRYFKRIVECSETGDGLECLKTYRLSLEQELEQEFSPIIYQTAKSCLNLASRNSNDLALLLNIQTCFHQADYENFKSRAKTTMILKWKYFMFVTLFLVGYVLLRRTFLKRDYRSETEVTLTLNYKDLLAKVERIEISNSQLFKSLAELKRDQIAKLDSSKNEGILNEVENLKKLTFLLRTSVSKVNQCLFGGYTLTAAYSSPQDKSRRKSNPRPHGKQAGAGIIKSSFDSDIELVSPSTIASTPNHVGWEPRTTKFKSPLILDSSKIILTNKSYSSAKDYGGGNIANEDIKNKFKNSILEVIKDKKINSSVSSKSSETRDESKEVKPNLRYKDVPKFNASGDKYKRVFIPGRGWVATKIIEDEESTLGSEAFVIELK